MSKKIIITGITGFAGQHLESFLNSTYKIIGVYRSKDKLNFETIKKSDLDNTEAIVHLAGKAHDLKNTSEPEEYFQVNTELTKLLFDLFLESSSKTFIYMSTLKAIADTSDEILTENHIPKPLTPYGKSKLQAEEYIRSQPIPKGKRVIILRPCMIFGPNNKGNLKLLNLFISKGIPYPFKKFENKRSFLFIENLTFTIHEIIKNNQIESGVFNIADNNPMSTLTLVKHMAQIQNKTIAIPNIPKSFIQLIARFGDILPLPINTERLGKLTSNYVCSNQKILDALKKPLPFSTYEGLEKTFKIN